VIPFEKRVKIYGFMLIDPISREYMLMNWFEDPVNQPILQNVLREFMIFGIAQNPGLRSYLVDRHQWEEVESNSRHVMDNFRNHISSQKKDSFRDWYSTITEVLVGFDKYQLTFHDVGENPRRFIELMYEECTAFDNTNFCKAEYREKRLSDDNVKAMKMLIQRTPLYDIPWFILARMKPNYRPCMYRDDNGEWRRVLFDMNKNPFETDERKIVHLIELMYDFFTDHDPKRIRSYLKTLTVYEYQKIKNFFYILRERHVARVFVLPMNYYEKQLIAMCKKYKVARPIDIPVEAGMFYYSPVCGFKGFIVPTDMTKQKTDNLNANGSIDTMYCWETDSVVCLHKMNKSKKRKQNPNKRTTVENFCTVDVVNPKKLSKEHNKNVQNETCSNTPLNMISLLGFGLECQDGFIVLCCKCANPCLFDLSKFEDDTLVCTMCTKNTLSYEDKSCFWCMKTQKHVKDEIRTMSVYDDIRVSPRGFGE
jgi:hypothetical protein